MLKIIYITLILFANTLFGAPLDRIPTELKQPDNTTIQCFMSGDEFFNYLHTEEGYLIIRGDDGFYYFADKSGKEIIASNWRVDLHTPESLPLQKWLKPDRELIQAKVNEMQNSSDSKQYIKDKTQTASKGKVNNLVVFIRFADQQEYNYSIDIFDVLFNRPDSLSMKNYYLEASFGDLEVTTHFLPKPINNTVISYQDTEPRSYYQVYNQQTNPNGYQGNEEWRREKELLTRALEFIVDKVPDNINFDSDNDGNIDNVVFIVQGGTEAWSSLLWPHRSWYSGDVTLNNRRVRDYNFIQSDIIFTGNYGIGTICHEYFHSLGAPDLYHYNQDDKMATGAWDLMERTQNPPQLMCNYLKYQYTGWVSKLPEISEDGKYSLYPTSSQEKNIYKLKLPSNNDEFLVLEYRRKEGQYDSGIPGTGLLVYKIDNNLNGEGNGSGPPDEIYLFRPNGGKNSEGNVNQANLSNIVNRKSISDFTNPQLYSNYNEKMNVEIYNITDHGDSITFNITYIQRPRFISPEDLSFDVELSPTIKWLKVKNALQYNFEISSDSLFENVIFQEIISDTMFKIPIELAHNAEYHVRAKAIYFSEISDWSEVIRFTTIPSNIQLIEPKNEQSEIPIMTGLKWSKVGNSVYTISVSDNPDFKTKAYSRFAMKDTSVQIPTPLEINKTYYWKVQSKSSTGYTTDSDIFQFTTKENDLVITSLHNSKDVCLGDSLVLFVNNAGSDVEYQWYIDDELQEDAIDSVFVINDYSHENNGTYSCELITTDKSIALKTEDIILKEIEPIQVTVFPKVTNIYMKDTLTLAAELLNEFVNIKDAVKFQWFKNDDELKYSSKYQDVTSNTLKIISPDSTDLADEFFLRIITKCGDSTYTELASLILSLSENQEFDKYFSITPNPASTHFVISPNSSINEFAEISLYDIAGREISNIWSGYITSNPIEFNLNSSNHEITAGTYFVTVFLKNKIMTEKIIISR